MGKVLWIWVGMFIVGALLGGFCWTYTINTWLLYCGKEASVQYWQGIVIGCIPGIGQVSIPVAVLTWVLMLFLA